MSEAINSLNYGDNTYTFTLPYGVCSTAEKTAAKEVTVDNFSLEAGAVVIVKFENANGVASPTLNVNGTGAKSIMRYGTTTTSTGTTTTGWVAGAVQMFTYDGTNWIRDYWNNTTYSNASLGCGYATCDTAAATAAKVGSLSSYSLTTGGIVSVKFTYNVPANATLNINSKGAKNIYYRGAKITADVIKAGDIATFVYSSQYHLIAIDRWQQDIASKQATITGAATTITSDNLTASRALISNSSGKVDVSGITSTELGYLDGVTSAIQTQLNGKAPSSHNHTVANITDLTATATELNYMDGVTSNVQTQLDGKAASSHNHSASNITSGTIAAARLPAASGTVAGITLVYPSASCTTFSSDSGTVTPLAVQKGAKMFAITRPASSTDKAITRYSNTTGDVQDSKIIIEDVTNTKDTSKKAQVISIPAEGNKKMVYGYCTDQVDGTSFIGGVFPADATEYPYASGLAIGGTSGNLLWKGAKVATVNDIPAAYTLPTASSTTLGGVKTTSTVSSTSGLTACPIISGVPYYKNSDTKVTQNAAITTSGAYPVLLGYSTDTTAVTNTVNKTNSVTVDPASGALQAKMLNLAAGIEIVPDSSSNIGGRIDFHYNGSSADYTSRIIENASGVVDVLGTSLKVNGNKVLTSSNVTAIYNTSVTFSSGLATYTNSAIKSSSICFVQRRAGSAGNNLAFTTTSNNGSVTIAAAAITSGAINVNIIIINP